MDLGGPHGDDLALDVEGQPKDEHDADMDALDTDDEAEDRALGIDTEESDGELLFLVLDVRISKLRLQSRCILSHCILYSPLKNR
jgi:hypothetical protein